MNESVDDIEARMSHTAHTISERVPVPKRAAFMAKAVIARPELTFLHVDSPLHARFLEILAAEDNRRLEPTPPPPPSPSPPPPPTNSVEIDGELLRFTHIRHPGDDIDPTVAVIARYSALKGRDWVSSYGGGAAAVLSPDHPHHPHFVALEQAYLGIVEGRSDVSGIEGREGFRQECLHMQSRFDAAAAVAAAATAARNAPSTAGGVDWWTHVVVARLALDNYTADEISQLPHPSTLAPPPSLMQPSVELTAPAPAAPAAPAPGLPAAPAAAPQRCPLCGTLVPADELRAHIRAELLPADASRAPATASATTSAVLGISGGDDRLAVEAVRAQTK